MSARSLGSLLVPPVGSKTKPESACTGYILELLWLETLVIQAQNQNAAISCTYLTRILVIIFLEVRFFGGHLVVNIQYLHPPGVQIWALVMQITQHSDNQPSFGVISSECHARFFQFQKHHWHTVNCGSILPVLLTYNKSVLHKCSKIPCWYWFTVQVLWHY